MEDILPEVQDSKLPATACLECGYVVDRVTGPGSPEPGSLSLCVKCGSLNAFGEDLQFVQPTLEQYLWAARNSALQALRRKIVAYNEEKDKGPE
jgi:NAD-dependent SIR2 family protein deacetylase